MSGQKHEARATKRQPCKTRVPSSASRDPAHLGQGPRAQLMLPGVQLMPPRTQLTPPRAPDPTARSGCQRRVVIEPPRAYLAQLAPHTDASIRYFIGEDEIQLADGEAQGAGLG